MNCTLSANYQALIVGAEEVPLAGMFKLAVILFNTTSSYHEVVSPTWYIPDKKHCLDQI